MIVSKILCHCDACGRQVLRWACHIRSRVFCSQRCAWSAQRVPDALERKRACKLAYARRVRAAAVAIEEGVER